VGVLDQEHLARADHALLAVARGDLDAGVEIDDVLPPRRRMPIEIIVALGLAENDAGRRETLRQLAARPVFHPFDFDVAEMGLAVGIDVKIVNTHGSSLVVRRYSGIASRVQAGTASLATAAPGTEDGIREVRKRRSRVRAVGLY
jgi:hypothetical protein